MTSRIINTLINDIGIVDLTEEEKRKKGTQRDQEIGFVTYGRLASGLKQTTYDCITNTDEVYAYEQQGETMLRTLYEFYSQNVNYLPPEYRAENIMKQYEAEYERESRDKDLRDALQERLVFDYISGMMDEYVKTTYHRLKDNQ